MVDDTDRAYAMAISLRRRHARDRSVDVNEEHGRWRAKRLRNKLETDDESHFVFSRECLERCRDAIKRSRDNKAQSPVPGGTKSDESVEDPSSIGTDDCSKPTSTSWPAPSEKGVPSSGRAQKQTLGRTWKSVSNNFMRAAEFTSKRLSSVRNKMRGQGVGFENATRGTAETRFLRWPTRNRSRIHVEFESVVPRNDP
eukprot:TRINITY_DN8197_c0_g2_i1.p1 TRINITY_DN8197_c0_g2~~TRINITY_DN8197_c0_g2_i1.p1  ORF type:complete len:198 (-),score=19.07 TRINITY_DN8197_c0_g2_i1:480-1073(-)